jgi:hypothetical protein
MKKMGLFWFAAALLGAALIFGGCETEADTETVTVREGVTNTLLGLQELLDTDGVNYVKYLGSLTIGNTLVIPAGKTVTVSGAVTVNGVLAVGGTLTLTGTITNSGIVIGSKDFLEGKVTGSGDTASIYSSIAAVKEALTDATASVNNAAILDVNSSELTAANVPTGKTLYVLGNLTFDALPATAAVGDVLAYGKFVIAATPVNLAATEVAKLNISATTITTSDGTTARTLTLAAATTVKAVNAAAGLTFSGTEPFEVTGDAYFGGNVTFGGEATFGGIAVFGGNVTLKTAGATFAKDAFVANGNKITLELAACTITLKPGAALAVGAPSPNVPYPFYEVISNEATGSSAGNLKLTPAAGAVLTFGNGGITQSGSAAHGIEIEGIAGLTAGASYTVLSETGKAGTLTLATGATLTLYAGYLATEGGGPIPESKLVLTGHATAGATLAVDGDGVIAGATTITGEWQAVGTGTVTIASDGTTTSRITASDDTVVLTAGTDGTITQAAGAGNNLTIGTATSIDLTNAGTIILKAAASDGGSINLSTTTSKITGLKGGTTDRNLVATNIANATYTVGTATGEVTGGGDEGDGGAWIGGGHDTGPNPIKATDGAAADASISKTTLIGAS